MLFTTSLLLLSCAPNSSSTLATPDRGNRVDQNSFNSLIDLKWCQPIQPQQDFKIAWKFSKDLFIATKYQGDLKTNQEVTQKYSWSMQNKTLIVKNLMNGSIIFQRDLSFDYDFTTGKKLMNWQTVSQSSTQCQNGICSGTHGNVEVMKLSECD
jgi:hypothetical protein